jgi:hypothetical protein
VPVGCGVVPQTVDARQHTLPGFRLTLFDRKESTMHTTHCVPLLGRTYRFAAERDAGDDVVRSVTMLADGQGNLDTIRRLLLRHCDILAPPGSAGSSLIPDLFAEPDVRQRLMRLGRIETGTPQTLIADVSYGNLVKIGQYRGSRIELQANEKQTLCVTALWLGQGVEVGRGFDVFTTTCPTLPAQYAARVLSGEWTSPQQEILKTLLRDGTTPQVALQAATLL